MRCTPGAFMALTASPGQQPREFRSFFDAAILSYHLAQAAAAGGDARGASGRNATRVLAHPLDQPKP